MFEKEKKPVEFCGYSLLWETEAEKTIGQLKNIFKEKAADIQHIGGTAMKRIKSKPIIDIAVGIDDFDIIVINSYIEILKSNGFICSLNLKDIKNDADKILFYKLNNKNQKTHIIHVVRHNSKLWFDYIIFRDYLNFNENKAREFENLKLSVNGKYRYAVPSYIKAKSDFINKVVADNFYTMMLGKTVTVKSDHKNAGKYPKLSDGVYPLTYGHIKNLNADAYVIGVYDYNTAEEFTGNIVAYVTNRNKSENNKISFIVAKENMIFYKPDIYEAVKFLDMGETDIVCLYEKSCGAVVYTRDNGDIKFLLVKGRASNRVGFPKGHIEKGETEAETAVREVYEETSLNVVLYPDFKEEYGYTISGYVKKTVLYFLAEFNSREKYKIRDVEILEQWLVTYENAYAMLTFNQDKKVLKKAYEKIISE